MASDNGGEEEIHIPMSQPDQLQMEVVPQRTSITVEPSHEAAGDDECTPLTPMTTSDQGGSVPHRAELEHELGHGSMKEDDVVLMFRAKAVADRSSKRMKMTCLAVCGLLWATTATTLALALVQKSMVNRWLQDQPVVDLIPEVEELASDYGKQSFLSILRHPAYGSKLAPEDQVSIDADAALLAHEEADARYAEFEQAMQQLEGLLEESSLPADMVDEQLQWSAWPRQADANFAILYNATLVGSPLTFLVDSQQVAHEMMGSHYMLIQSFDTLTDECLERHRQLYKTSNAGILVSSIGLGTVILSTVLLLMLRRCRKPLMHQVYRRMEQCQRFYTDDGVRVGLTHPESKGLLDLSAGVAALRTRFLVHCTAMILLSVLLHCCLVFTQALLINTESTSATFSNAAEWSVAPVAFARMEVYSVVSVLTSGAGMYPSVWWSDAYNLMLNQMQWQTSRLACSDVPTSGFKVAMNEQLQCVKDSILVPSPEEVAIWHDDCNFGSLPDSVQQLSTFTAYEHFSYMAALYDGVSAVTSPFHSKPSYSDDEGESVLCFPCATFFARDTDQCPNEEAVDAMWLNYYDQNIPVADTRSQRRMFLSQDFLDLERAYKKARKELLTEVNQLSKEDLDRATSAGAYTIVFAIVSMCVTCAASAALAWQYRRLQNRRKKLKHYHEWTLSRILCYQPTSELLQEFSAPLCQQNVMFWRCCFDAMLQQWPTTCVDDLVHGFLSPGAVHWVDLDAESKNAICRALSCYSARRSEDGGKGFLLEGHVEMLLMAMHAVEKSLHREAYDGFLKWPKFLEFVRESHRVWRLQAGYIAVDREVQITSATTGDVLPREDTYGL